MGAARYFRKRYSSKYQERFVQGLDYRELPKADRNGHKYEMLRPRTIATSVKGLTIDHEYFSINVFGLMTLKLRYRWDGPSGPTVDTASFMRGSGAHDVWFQILRELEKLLKSGKLILSQDWRIARPLLRRKLFNLANQDLRTHCKEDGMMWPRYHWVYYSVKKLGGKYAGGV